MSKKESALDLAKFIDKGVRVKLAGGREGELTCCCNAPLCPDAHSAPLHGHVHQSAAAVWLCSSTAANPHMLYVAAAITPMLCLQ
jgi:hypothetical protein